MKDLLQVGDVVITDNMMGVIEYPITRVTKTLAKSRRNDGYEYTFKREISCSMAHPYQQWNTTKYSVRKENEYELNKRTANQHK